MPAIAVILGMLRPVGPGGEAGDIVAPRPRNRRAGCIGEASGIRIEAFQRPHELPCNLPAVHVAHLPACAVIAPQVLRDLNLGHCAASFAVSPMKNSPGAPLRRVLARSVSPMASPVRVKMIRYCPSLSRMTR